MKRIPLTQGKFALVDDEDFDRLNKYKWFAQKGPYTYYASRSYNIKGLYDITKYPLAYRRLRIMMARQIMCLCADDPCVPDHKDHNGLNNQRYNLRTCTVSQNCMNKKGKAGSSSPFKGVSRTPSGGFRVMCGGKYVGFFESETVAAQTYDDYAIFKFGEFAYLNFPPDGIENDDSRNISSKSLIAT